MKDRQEVVSEVLESKDQVDFPFDGRLMRNKDPNDDDDDEEMIDLQANEEEQSCLLTDDGKDGQDTDGNISEDESFW